MQFLTDNWWLTAIVMLILGGAVYKIFFSRRDRKQNTFTVTEDNRIVDLAMTLRLGHLVSDREMEGYVYCPEILCYKYGTNNLVALLDERDSMPMLLSGQAKAKRNTYTKERMQQIAQACHDRELLMMEKNNTKDRITSVMGFVIGAFAVVTLLVILAGIYLVK
jgi:hypothetical protein